MMEVVKKSVSPAVPPKAVTMLEAINMALADAMADDDKVLVLGEDVADLESGGVVGVTRGLSARFGDKRVRSTPISEQAIVGAAIGASMIGWKPVAEIMMMNFTAVAMDMIVNHAAKLRFMSGGQTSVPITIRTMTGVGLGSGGQHSDYLEAWFAHTAGMKVVAASNPADAYGLLRSCIEDPDPCLFIENLPSYWSPGTPPKRGERIPLGKARIAREGADLTVITYARMVDEALAAAEAVAKEGLSIEIIDLRTISPWDRDTVLASARKTGRVLIVHEAVKKFGVGAEIASDISHSLFGVLKKPVERLGAPFSPSPFSKPLETQFAPDRIRIAAAVAALAK
jgi:acetoin:2,6-dichlorophenolindophenol oxidoreductase subunit beta